MVVLGFIWFYWVLLGFTGFYPVKGHFPRASPQSTAFCEPEFVYWVLLGFALGIWASSPRASLFFGGGDFDVIIVVVVVVVVVVVTEVNVSLTGR